MNPVINLYNSNNWWYNVQNLTVLNPDGVTWQTQKAIQRVVYTKMSDDIGSGTYGQRTRCNFLVFKQLIPDNVIPQINSRITDMNGDHWLVYDIENKYFGNVIKLFTESAAGLGVTDMQYPEGTTTSTTSTTATTPEPCENNGIQANYLELIEQQNMCVKSNWANDPPYVWFAENLALTAGQSAAVKWEVLATGVVDFAADATGMCLGTAIARINGVVVGGGNFACNTLNFSTGVTAGDEVEIIFSSSASIIKGAVNILIKMLVPTTTTTTSTSSTSTSTSSTTTSTTSSSTTTGAPNPPTGMRAWYDPSDINNLWQNNNKTNPVTADGDPVGYMIDLSGNVFDVASAGAPYNLGYATNAINGLSALQNNFAGPFTYLGNFANVFINGPFTFSYVVKRRPEVYAGRYVVIGAKNWNSNYESRVFGKDPATNYTLYDTFSQSCLYPEQLFVGTTNVVVHRYDGFNLLTWINGVQTTSFSPQTNNSGDNRLLIGSNPFGGEGLDCYIGEVVYYDSALSGGNIDQLNSYLVGKWL